jgi:hypothetical protein
MTSRSSQHDGRPACALAVCGARGGAPAADLTAHAAPMAGCCRCATAGGVGGGLRAAVLLILIRCCGAGRRGV